jgi:hypothetical protein
MQSMVKGAVEVAAVILSAFEATDMVTLQGTSIGLHRLV